MYADKYILEGTTTDNWKKRLKNMFEAGKRLMSGHKDNE
jgi:hypothetical protein